jgi:hypothetical protein
MGKKKATRDDATPTLFKLTEEDKVRLGQKLAKTIRAKENNPAGLGMNRSSCNLSIRAFVARMATSTSCAMASW